MFPCLTFNNNKKISSQSKKEMENFIQDKPNIKIQEKVFQKKIKEYIYTYKTESLCCTA